MRIVPPWLRPLTELRRRGAVPPGGAVALSLAVTLPRFMLASALFVPPTYRLTPADDLVALRGLDIELIFGLRDGFPRLHGLAAAAIAAGCHRLVLTCADPERPCLAVVQSARTAAADNAGCQARAAVETDLAAGRVGNLLLEVQHA
jgi:hypothetical protein